jgi:NAD(P)-dependent dehydrogenase (short-subunit alcohol dehydrogenase family)
MNQVLKRIGYAAAGTAAVMAARSVYRQVIRYDFIDRTVLITGGSRGLGLVLARQLASQGARLILCARDAEELRSVEAELNDRGYGVLTIPCNVTDRDQVRSMFDQIDSKGVAVDVVINNAGMIQTGPMETMTIEDYEEAMKAHLYGPLYVNEAALPVMRRRGQGRIVNVSSIGGRISVPHLLPYSASKFALVGYSLGLRSELAKDGIVVTTICPGLMRTGSPRNAFFKGQHRAEYAWFKISDSLPLLSISAEAAATKIIEACRYGDSFVVLGAPIKLAEKLYSLCPGLGADALAVINRLLPGPGGIGQQRAYGYESESMLSQSPLTVLTEQAAARNNEV